MDKGLYTVLIHVAIADSKGAVVSVLGAQPDFKYPANSGYYPMLSAVATKRVGNNASIGILNICIDEREVQRKFSSALL